MAQWQKGATYFYDDPFYHHPGRPAFSPLHKSILAVVHPTPLCYSLVVFLMLTILMPLQFVARSKIQYVYTLHSTPSTILQPHLSSLLQIPTLLLDPSQGFHLECDQSFDYSGTSTIPFSRFRHSLPSTYSFLIIDTKH